MADENPVERVATRATYDDDFHSSVFIDVWNDAYDNEEIKDLMKEFFKGEGGKPDFFSVDSTSSIFNMRRKQDPVLVLKRQDARDEATAWKTIAEAVARVPTLRIIRKDPYDPDKRFFITYDTLQVLRELGLPQAMYDHVLPFLRDASLVLRCHVLPPPVVAQLWWRIHLEPVVTQRTLMRTVSKPSRTFYGDMQRRLNLSALTERLGKATWGERPPGQLSRHELKGDRRAQRLLETSRATEMTQDLEFFVVQEDLVKQGGTEKTPWLRKLEEENVAWAHAPTYEYIDRDVNISRDSLWSAIGSHDSETGYVELDLLWLVRRARTSPNEGAERRFFSTAIVGTSENYRYSDVPDVALFNAVPTYAAFTFLDTDEDDMDIRMFNNIELIIEDTRRVIPEEEEEQDSLVKRYPRVKADEDGETFWVFHDAKKYASDWLSLKLVKEPYRDMLRPSSGFHTLRIENFNLQASHPRMTLKFVKNGQSVSVPIPQPLLPAGMEGADARIRIDDLDSDHMSSEDLRLARGIVMERVGNDVDGEHLVKKFGSYYFYCIMVEAHFACEALLLLQSEKKDVFADEMEEIVYAFDAFVRQSITNFKNKRSGLNLENEKEEDYTFIRTEPSKWTRIVPQMGDYPDIPNFRRLEKLPKKEGNISKRMTLVDFCGKLVRFLVVDTSIEHENPQDLRYERLLQSLYQIMRMDYEKGLAQQVPATFFLLQEWIQRAFDLTHTTRVTYVAQTDESLRTMMLQALDRLPADAATVPQRAVVKAANERAV